MAIDLTELLALSPEERMKLGETLMESTLPPDIAALLRDFVDALERTNRALDFAIARLSAFDERLARGRAEARETALSCGDAWPLPLPR